MAKTEFDLLDFMIQTATERQERQAMPSHFADIGTAFQAIAGIFQMTSEDRALRAFCPEGKRIPIANHTVLRNAILEASNRHGDDFGEIAETFGISNTQLSEMLRGEQDTRVDLWQLIALSEYCNIRLDLDISPKEKSSTPTPQDVAKPAI